MRQRVMIAMALSCNPAILIADEPTTALDVTVQAQILELMRDLQNDFNSSIMLITHNLGVVSQMADHVAVMYLGQVVEYGTVRDIFHRPVASVHRRVCSSRCRCWVARRARSSRSRAWCRHLRRRFQAVRLPSAAHMSSPSAANSRPSCANMQPGHKAACWLY